MPPHHLGPSADQIIASLLRRVEALEFQLDQSKQARFVSVGGIWKYLGSPGAEVLIDTAAAPDLQDFFVYVGTGDPHSYLEIWDAGSGVGDSFVVLTTTGDMGLYADGNTLLIANGDLGLGCTDLHLEAGQHTYVALPTSSPGGSGRLWNDSGTVKIT